MEELQGGEKKNERRKLGILVIFLNKEMLSLSDHRRSVVSYQYCSQG